MSNTFPLLVLHLTIALGPHADPQPKVQVQAYQCDIFTDPSIVFPPAGEIDVYDKRGNGYECWRHLDFWRNRK